MARPRKILDAAVAVENALVALVILSDGVFPFADVRMDKGDVVECPADVAAILMGRGHARRA